MEAVRLAGMPGAPGAVGLIRVRAIGPRTAAEVDRALARWDAAGQDPSGEVTPLVGVVLDLRGNPGGRVEGAAEIAERFLPAGAVVYRWRDPAGRTGMRRARPGRRPRAEPLVVLVDGATASAAELLAGALAANGRACLAGRRTYGKGRLERLAPTAEAADRGARRLPAGEYRLPDGRGVEGRGLVPHLALDTPAQAAAWLAARRHVPLSRCRTGRPPRAGHASPAVRLLHP